MDDGKNTLRHTLSCEPGVPLWQRVPSTDEHGALLSDFMMLIPGLSKRDSKYQGVVLNKLQAVLNCYENIVVFADLNLRLNILWVSMRPLKGMCIELPAAIKLKVPEAVLVSSKY